MEHVAFAGQFRWHSQPPTLRQTDGARIEEISRLSRRVHITQTQKGSFSSSQTYSKGIADLFQIDLVDLSNLVSFNDGMKYLLTCIDVFTKRAWAVPVRTKSARDVVEAFEKILADQKCTMVQSDKGTEFLNTSFQSMLRHHGIHFYTSENDDLKAAIVERFNRTLKEKMFRYFTHRNTRRYVDVLDLSLIHI